MGYLDRQYLGGDLSDDVDLDGLTDDEGPTVSSGVLISTSAEMIVLPGGITMKRTTFWLLVGTALIAALVIYAKRKEQAA